MPFTRPHDLLSLEQLATQIRQQQAPIRLGEKTRAALSGLLRHPKNTALLSITELAQQLDVNASTLTRLAKRLGFSGFAEFQRLFRDSISLPNPTFYSHQASRQLQHWGSSALFSSAADTTQQRLEQLATENINNIQHSITALSPPHLAAAAQAIASAKRVRIHGVRQYSALAQFMAYGLSLIRSDVARLDACSLGLAEGLAQLEPKDVLISASVSPYTQEVLIIHEHARQAQLTTISLTDHAASPLAINTDYAFLIPYHSSFFSNSISAYFVLAEGLLNQVAWELGSSALEAIHKREQLIAALNIETHL